MRRYELAYAIAKLAYTEMHTFNEGRQIYLLALMEYYKLLRLEFFTVGALESVLLLLSSLGYDDQCLSLIDFVLKRLKDQKEIGETITIKYWGGNTDEEEVKLLEWVYGYSPEVKRPKFEEELEVLNDHQWAANSFLVPFLLINIRQMTHDAHMGDFYFFDRSLTLFEEIDDNCVVSYYEDPIQFVDQQVLCSLSPDSELTWGEIEAGILLANKRSIANTRWSHKCLLFWQILRSVVKDTAVCVSYDYIMKYVRERQDLNTRNGSIGKNKKERVVKEDDSKKVTSLMDLFSSQNPQAGKLYCIHCRQQLSSLSCDESAQDEKEETEPAALQCSRCKVVHYCSRECQKANYGLHKQRCKNILKLRSMSPSTSKEENSIDDKTRRYELAYSIVDLTYLSTDTIDRGRQMYHLALVEYYQLLRLDFHYIGALESVLLLLSILGYDDHLLGLTDFVFYRLRIHPAERITICKKDGKDVDRLLEWVQGSFPPERKPWINSLDIHVLGSKQWNHNNFFVPLLFWSMRKQTLEITKNPSIQQEMTTTLGGTIETTSVVHLHVLRALLPDSIKQWRQDEAKELLAKGAHTTDFEYLTEDELEEYQKVVPKANGEHWETSCILFWDILKDAVAYTPGVVDTLEGTIYEVDRLKPYLANRRKERNVGVSKY